MSNLSDLLAQRAELEKLIAQTRRDERERAIGQVHALMAEFGLTAADIGKRAAKKGATGNKVAAKYRNKATGDTWSGRGLQPRWLKAALSAGKKLSDFTV